jgi:pimeloyl-ACP methyl ester carboxylesterase
VAFLAVEYPGYGIYAGSCSSDKMLQDAHAVMKHVLCKCYEENIIVMGRSIGSGVAIDVAAKYHKLRCLSLISPFTSLQAVVKEYAGSFLCRIVQERFRNLEKMSRVQCPTLFIHGDQDNLVPIDHSESLLKEAGGIAYLERIAGMDHNTFIFRLHIALPMLTFLGKIQPVQEQY